MLSDGHEHAFFAHEDPRYLICACGQYAVRTRDLIGQSSVRLIEPPQPVLRRPEQPTVAVVDAPGAAELSDATRPVLLDAAQPA